MVFFVKFIYAIFPSAFILGLLKSHYKEEKFSNIYLIGIISLILGAVIQKLFMRVLYDSEFISVIGGVLSCCLLIFLFTFLLVKIKALFYILTSILLVYSGAMLSYLVHDLPLTGTQVINSDLVIHVSYIFLAILIGIFIYEASQVLSKSQHKSVMFYIILISSIVLNLIIILGEILKHLIKNDLIVVTSGRISLIAKITHYSYLNVYVYSLFLFLFGIIYFLNRTNDKILNLENSKLRKLKYEKIVQNRWLKTTGLILFITLAHLSYYDLVASQPPKLSPATILQADKNGNIVLDTTKYLDGDLYRFAYITQDGHKVRFFAINRYKDKQKVTVVFDSCMICGDMGYIKQDNQVICLACSVRVFIPSIGTAGGCNPIPLKYTKQGKNIIISSTTLENGSTYFTQIVKREVTDPISGAKLINKEAKFTYDYAGRTYYFESEKNMENFRDNPAKYTQHNIKPRWRVQGHEE